MSVIDTTRTTPADEQDDVVGETTAQAVTARPDPDMAEPTQQPDTTQAEDGYLVHLDPATVALEDNIRADADLDDPFVASVRDQGVLQPVRAYLGDDGQVTVRDGQRRVLAAIKVGRPTVPVYVVAPGAGTTARVVQQYDANERRAAMSDADRIGAWKQLQLEGLSLTAIAKATHENRAHVQAGLDVIASATATTAVVEHDLTLDQAAVLVEFEDDPASVKRLLSTVRVNPKDLAHEAQRIRDQRKTNQQIADLKADFAQRSIQVIAWPHHDDKDTLPLSDLTEADGSDLNPDTFAGRPGYRVAIRERDGVQVGHFAADWRTHGLKKRRADGLALTGWTEQQKCERRELIANNKAWPSAEVVRREWLTTFLARKTAPKDALAFVAKVAAEHPERLATALSTHQEMAASLIGGTYEWGKKHPLAVLLDANPTKATTVLLAVVLGALEQATSKSTWRNPGSADVTYFTAIKTWGYTLSDVENLILGITPQPATDATGDEPDESDDETDLDGDEDDEAGDDNLDQ